jgi:hypothetical protein
VITLKIFDNSIAKANVKVMIDRSMSDNLYFSLDRQHCQTFGGSVRGRSLFIINQINQDQFDHRVSFVAYGPTRIFCVNIFKSDNR